jgi:hypothetical protein
MESWFPDALQQQQQPSPFCGVSVESCADRQRRESDVEQEQEELGQDGGEEGNHSLCQGPGGKWPASPQVPFASTRE